MKTKFITNKKFESIGSMEYIYLKKDVRNSIIQDAISFINEPPFDGGGYFNEVTYSIYKTEIDFYDGCLQGLPKSNAFLSTYNFSCGCA